MDNLLGNPEKAKLKLWWEPKIGIQELIKEMVENDKKNAAKEIYWFVYSKLRCIRKTSIKKELKTNEFEF